MHKKSFNERQDSIEKTPKVMNPKEVERILRFEYDLSSVYEEDVGIVRVLESLIPENKLINPDQRLFQVMHLNTELVWYNIHYELRQAIAALRTEDYAQAGHVLQRSVMLTEIPYAALKTLITTLTQFSLLQMRRQLPAGATGTDSPGMRNLRKVSKVLWKAYEEALSQCGQTSISFAQLRMQKSEQQKSLPEKQVLLAQVFDHIQQLDIKFMEWKQLHLRLVWTNLGGVFVGDINNNLDKISVSSQTINIGEDENEKFIHSANSTHSSKIPTSLSGRPIKALQKVTATPLFPKLWKIPDAIYQAMQTKAIQ